MRLLFALLIYCFSLISVNADEITIQQAKDIAFNYLASETLITPLVSDYYCVVCDKEAEGYVIIDRRKGSRRHVIGFSYESKWDEAKMPPVLIDWLNGLTDNDSKRNTRSEPTDTIDTIQFTKEDVLPLLTTHWHQNSPYNDLSPIIEDGNVKTAAGCVAIAAAQIAYYWRNDNPSYTLRDTPTYIYGGAPVSIVIPKGSPNKWDIMQDQYSDDDTQESRDAVAQLCYVIGTTSYLNYASSTGGSIRDAANAMYSQFNLLSEYIPKSKIIYPEWVELLYNDIKKGYPVMCSGVGNGGHAFVLDGYDKETGLFHFNFGWGGFGDGYYPIDGSEDAMGGYFQNQSVVYDIHPSSMNIEASLYCTYDNPNTFTVNAVSTIRNNSTLPIKQLFIYAVPDDSTLEETESAIWQGTEIANDGIEHSVTATFNITGDKKFVLYLTNEMKCELAHCALNIESSIVNTQNIPMIIGLHNLFGQKINNPQKGIYIIYDGTQKKKILKRYDQTKILPID